MRNWIIILVIILVAGFFAFRAKDQGDTGVKKVDAKVGEYFATKMRELGAADIGQPIEGFDNNLLIKAFPGLIPADFDGVETLEGVYSVVGGSMDFLRKEGSSITSAERTISEEGFRTLLTNLAKRFNMTVDSNDNVDVIINLINTDDVVQQG